MMWLFTQAWAQDAAAAGSSGGGCDYSSIGLLALIVGVFYLLVIRPQTKARKEHEQLLATMKKGDEVVSEGGICGVVHEVRESEVVVQVSDRTRIRFKKESIQAVDRSDDDEASSKGGK